MTDELRLFSAAPTQAGWQYTYHALARNTDPATSHKAAAGARVRSGSQKVKLLRQYDIWGPLTAWEAGKASLLADRPGCAYWRRVTELLHENLIVETGEVRPGPTGEDQRVCSITLEGQQLLVRLGL
jgi:hypothetical protein